MISRNLSRRNPTFLPRLHVENLLTQYLAQVLVQIAFRGYLARSLNLAVLKLYLLPTEVGASAQARLAAADVSVSRRCSPEPGIILMRDEKSRSNYRKAAWHGRWR